ncbi:MAG: hypothetical protein CVU39_09040 [Chloroflexi bacterium HGW-Chloroflexi-10]|nr:MAG: hypothetical protein CVU39_09040 [Chloroflexi bacterium HGW-Chloroflexi-10]
MAELKTKVTDASVNEFLDSIPDETKRKDTYLLFKMMQEATKTEARMWGDSIIGFGDYHYVGKSGREGDWFLAGLSPRKQTLTLYMLSGWEQHDELLAKLGKHSLGKGCLYIKRLADVDMTILNKLIVEAVERAKKQAQEDAKIQAKSNK